MLTWSAETEPLVGGLDFERQDQRLKNVVLNAKDDILANCSATCKCCDVLPLIARRLRATNVAVC